MRNTVLENECFIYIHYMFSLYFKLGSELIFKEAYSIQTVHCNRCSLFSANTLHPFLLLSPASRSRLTQLCSLRALSISSIPLKGKLL